MIIRLLSMADREQAKNLWQSIFDDPPAFVNWFFENRYMPQWSVGVFEGRELISVIHGMPMSLSLGMNGSFPALMTSGVATIPSARGQGYMHDAMRFLQKTAQERGIVALFNHPQRAGAYAHLGFRPSTQTKVWHGQGTTAGGRIVPFSEAEAFRIYTALSNQYGGFACRDAAAFHLKMEDYASDGAKAFLVEDGGEAVGYCVYFDKEDVFGEEALSLAGYDALLQDLKRISNGRTVAAKLPPDADAAGEIVTQNIMLAPSDVWDDLRACGRPCFCVDEY